MVSAQRSRGRASGMSVTCLGSNPKKNAEKTHQIAGIEGRGHREAKTDPGMILQGLVEQQAETFGEVGGALSGEKLQNGVEKVRLVVVGHV